MLKIKITSRLSNGQRWCEEKDHFNDKKVVVAVCSRNRLPSKAAMLRCGTTNVSSNPVVKLSLESSPEKFISWHLNQEQHTLLCVVWLWVQNWAFIFWPHCMMTFSVTVICSKALVGNEIREKNVKVVLTSWIKIWQSFHFFSVLTEESSNSPTGHDRADYDTNAVSGSNGTNSARDHLVKAEVDPLAVAPSERSPIDSAVPLNDNGTGGSTGDPSAYAMHHRYADHVSGEYSTPLGGNAYGPSTGSVSSHHYGQSTYYGASPGAGYLNNAMAPLLYPHLYSASSVNPSLHLHGNGLSGTEQGGGGGGGGIVDDYGLGVGRDVGNAESGVNHQVYSSLEGDDSQTGPIRGAYSSRTEHGGHVWRPYWSLKLCFQLFSSPLRPQHVAHIP